MFPLCVRYTVLMLAFGTFGQDGTSSSCGSSPFAAANQQVSGIEGVVYRVGGNRMPSPGVKPAPLRPVADTIYVFGLTNISQVDRVGSSPYYRNIQTSLILRAGTDDTGHFRIVLPPGKYSLFTRKGDLFYASRRDESNNIAPVTVLPGKLTWVECRVESAHKPVY